MRAKFINEKFEEKSDPIHDMGIGRINFVSLYSKMVGPAIDKWNNFLNTLVGKTVSGIMEADLVDYIKNGVAYPSETKRSKFSVKVKKIETSEEAWADVIIYDKAGNSYTLNGDEDYMIK